MRSVLDKLISWTGLALAAVLLVAGGLLTWANTFIADQVHDQLTMQDITMPEGDALKSVSPADAKVLKEFAGSKMDTGPEARAFADHYILAHMDHSSEGRSYSEVSGEFQAMSDEQKASPAGEEAGALRESLLQGNTLRGLLLYGYAFATMGTIAGYAAIAAFVGAFGMLLLGLLGLRHARRAASTDTV